MKHLLRESLKATGMSLLALVLTFGAANTSLAKSTVVSVSVEPQWPTNAQPGSVVLYTVTVTRAGEGELELALSSGDLPPGVTASFSVNPVRFVGRTPTTLTSTLVLCCTNLTATDDWPFTITATGRNETVTVINPVVQTGASPTAAAPAVRPHLTLDRLNSSSTRVRGQGAGGQSYQVQCTQSLSNPTWTVAGSSTADGNGRFTFIDSSTNPPSAMFYRTVTPTP